MTIAVFLLEEPSARELLSNLLPRILPQETIHYHFIVFEGKQDLEKNVERKVKHWLQPDTRFLILRDKDSGDCKAIKDNLFEKISRAGKASSCLIRIACHEIESFYLGDLRAVARGLEIDGLDKEQNKATYRNPDSLANAKQELMRITRKRYREIAGSRAISRYLECDGSNRSTSFNALVDGIRKLLC